MVRHNVYLPKGLFQSVGEKTLLNSSEITRTLLEAFDNGLIDIYELLKKLDEQKKQEK